MILRDNYFGNLLFIGFLLISISFNQVNAFSISELSKSSFKNSIRNLNSIFFDKLKRSSKLQVDETALSGIQVLLFQECEDEIGGLAEGGDSPAKVSAALNCARDVVIELLDPCMESYKETWNVIKCFTSLGTETEGIFTGLVADPNGFDDTQVDRFFEALTPLSEKELEANKCASLFGTAADPELALCILLYDPSDFETFVNDFFSGFQSDSKCVEAFNDLGFNDTSIFSTIVDGSAADVGLQTDTEDFKASEVDIYISGMIENVKTCDELSGGTLLDAIEDIANSGIVQQATVWLIVGSLIFQYIFKAL